MFIVEFFPVWMKFLAMVLLAIFVLFALILIISFSLHKKREEITKSENVSLVMFFSSAILMGVFFVAGHLNPAVETFDNPYSAREAADDDGRRANLIDTKIDEVEKKISQSLDVDKVEVDSTTEVRINVSNGNMTDFVAVEDGKIIDGKFYFTENTLEILVSGENDIIEHVSISTE